MKNDLKKLTNGYLSHAVRLQLVLVLVDASRGLKGSDIEFLERLEYYNKKALVVFSKVDKIKGGRPQLA